MGIEPAGAVKLTLYAVCTEPLHLPTPHPITALSRSTCLPCAVGSRQTDRAALTRSLTPDTNTHVPGCQTHTGRLQTLGLHHWHVEYSRRKEMNCCFQTRASSHLISALFQGGFLSLMPDSQQPASVSCKAGF